MFLVGSEVQVGSTVVDSWPLVGRQRHLETILAAYDARPAGAGAAGIVLVGEAGVGRTRLAREAVACLATRGLPTAWMNAAGSAPAVPMGALAPLLERMDEPPGAPLDAIGSIVTRFANREARGVLAVDDAHLLDPASAALLYQLAADGHAFVVVTVRAGDPVPDAVTALWIHELAARVDVAALPDQELGGLLEAALGARMDSVSTREVGRLCAGNPLLLRELLRAGLETGSLRRVGQVWRWTGGQYVTGRLNEVVRTRMGALPARLLELGELVACAEPLALSMLESLSDRALVVAAERSALIRVEPAGSRLLVRLAKPIYSDVLRAGTPRSHEREIWRVLAAALADLPARRRDDAVRTALWRQHAGEDCPPDVLLAAAAQAREQLDLDRTVTLAALAQRAGAGDPAGLAQAEALVQQGRYARAAQVLPASPGGLDGELRERWRVARMRIDYFGTERQDRTDTTWDEPGELNPGVDAARAWLLIAEGRNQPAMRLAAAAHRAAERKPALATEAAAAVTLSAGLLGQEGTVRRTLGPALATAQREAQTHPWGPVQVGAAGCLALLATGYLYEAQQVAEQSGRDAAATVERIGPNAAPIAGIGAAIRGMVAKAQGRAATALAALSEAVALLHDRPTLRLERLYLAELAATHALLGDLPAAHQRLAEADRHAGSPVRLMDAWVERARAWVSAAEGDLSRASALALNAATLARATEQPAIEALALFDAARFGDTGQAYRRLAPLATQLALPAASAMAQAACALRSPDGGPPLDLAARTLADHGYLLYAAEAATVAHARLARAGRRTAAQASLVRATTLAGDCEGATTSLLTRHGADGLLTSREVQIASLAATGQTAGTIATQLGLSIRTVNNHLGRIYYKLGVNGRAQLRTVLTEPVAVAVSG